LVDTNSLNGIRNASHRTLTACQDYCASVPACVAVDFNFDEDSCWLHLDADDLLDLFTQGNTNQYRVDRQCATGTAVTTTSTTTTSTAGLSAYQ